MSYAQDVKRICGLPAMLSHSERLFLYSSVLSFRPTTCLEIGANRGGSTTIIALALDRLGQGRLYSVDPDHRISGPDLRRIAHRVTLVHGASPAAVRGLPRDRPLDFVFIDGNHKAVAEDCEAVEPLLGTEALVLFHDAHFDPVRAAVDGWVAARRRAVLDHGVVDRTVDRSLPPALFAGIRAVTYRRAPLL